MKGACTNDLISSGNGISGIIWSLLYSTPCHLASLFAKWMRQSFQLPLMVMLARKASVGPLQSVRIEQTTLSGHWFYPNDWKSHKSTEIIIKITTIIVLISDQTQSCTGEYLPLQSLKIFI
jgi:hypothetical protein